MWHAGSASAGPDFVEVYDIICDGWRDGARCSPASSSIPSDIGPWQANRQRSGETSDGGAPPSSDALRPATFVDVDTTIVRAERSVGLTYVNFRMARDSGATRFTRGLGR